jgi:DNA-binding NarL/FixJ family response regulator
LSQVLIIDDDAVFGELLCNQLATAGIQAVFHHGWHKSTIAVEREKPAVVLIDVNMPGLPGPMLLETFRKALSKMPKVILMSSMDMRELRPIASAYRADAALNKSSSREHVIYLVQSML